MTLRRCGHISEVKEFNKFLGSLPHKHKIVIAGNHELSFDRKFKKNSEKFEARGGDADHSTGDCDTTTIPATFNASLLASPRSSHAGGDFFSAGMTLGSTSSSKGGSIPTLGMDRLTLSEAVEVLFVTKRCVFVLENKLCCVFK